MDYQEITKRVGALLQHGGFPPDEPLNSITPICDSYNKPPDYQIAAYSSVLADFGEWDRAEAVARSIGNNYNEKGTALAILAQRLAAAGLLDRAESVALSVLNSSEFGGVMVEKATALLAIASKRAEKGNVERAQSLLEEAEQTIEHIKRADHLLVGLLGDLAGAFHKMAESDRALNLWDRATDIGMKSIRAYRAGGAPDVDSWKSLEIIAQDMFAIGETERAERAMALIDNDDWRERALKRLRGSEDG